MRRPPTIVDVADTAGVSIMTVSRYFNAPEKLSRATYERVSAAVVAHNYVQNGAARALFRGQSKSLALIISNITNPFLTTVARGAEDAAHAHGYTLFICNTDQDDEKTRNYVTALASQQVDGVLVTPDTAAASLDPLARHAIPAVVLDQKVVGREVDVVRADSYAGARLLAEYLLARGFRRIAFVGGDADAFSVKERVRGLRDVLAPTSQPPIVVFDSFEEEAGVVLTAQLLATGPAPDVFVGANNVVSVGILKSLRAAKVNLPVASFDPLAEDLAGLFDPFIAVARQDAYDLGRRAAKALLERIANPNSPVQDHVLPMTLSLPPAGNDT